MHFDFSFEQRTLAESVAKILKSFPPVTQAAPYPYDAGQPMKALAALGLFGEGEEGSPLGHTDAVAVAMEAGRTIVAAPVGIQMAASLDVSPDPFLMAVAVAASSAFLTPIGHKNNTLILGPGGYSFGDYWRMGLPLEIIVVAVSIPAILVFWPL